MVSRMRIFISLLLIPFWLMIAVSISYASGRYFRADDRSPDVIQIAGGLYPRIYSRDSPHFEVAVNQRINPNTSLYNHALGGNRERTAYISTSISFQAAREFGFGLYRHRVFYVYEVAGAPNLMDMNTALGRFSPFGGEAEYAALGGVPLSQIIGWTRFQNGEPGRYVANPAYRRDLFDNTVVAPDESAHRLAGFPLDHPAWREAPWDAYAQPDCSGGSGQRKKREDCLSLMQELREPVLAEVRGKFYANSVFFISPIIVSSVLSQTYIW